MLDYFGSVIYCFSAANFVVGLFYSKNEHWNSEVKNSTGDRMGRFDAQPYPLSVSRMLPSKLKCPLLPVNVYRFGVPQVDNDEESEAENGKRQNNTVLHRRNF